MGKMNNLDIERQNQARSRNLGDVYTELCLQDRKALDSYQSYLRFLLAEYPSKKGKIKSIESAIEVLKSGKAKHKLGGS